MRDELGCFQFEQFGGDWTGVVLTCEIRICKTRPGPKQATATSSASCKRGEVGTAPEIPSVRNNSSTGVGGGGRGQLFMTCPVSYGLGIREQALPASNAFWHTYLNWFHREGDGRLIPTAGVGVDNEGQPPKLPAAIRLVPKS